MGMMADARTVVLVSVCAFAITAFFLAWSWRTHRLGNALGWWSAAFALASLDAVLLFVAPHTMAPFDWVDEVVFLAATFAVWFSFRSLNGDRAPVAAATAVLALFAAVVLVTDAPPRATHVLSVAIACGIVVLVLRETLRRGRNGKSWRVVAMAVVGIHGTILAIRSVLDDGDGTDSIMTLETVSEVVFVVEPMLMPMALGYIFLSLVFNCRHSNAVAETERDPLTGLLNRRGLERWIAAAEPGPLAVIMADIDHFKTVNDTHGHAAGDHVLAAIAARLAGEVRAGDALARLGGEEFCAVMHATPDAAVEAAERMRRAVAASPLSAADGVTVTASFGVALADPSADAEALAAAFKAADVALYDAKRGGRNRVAAAPELHGRRWPKLALVVSRSG